MAVRVSRKDLESKHVKLIQKHLMLQPKVKQTSRFAKNVSTSKDPIQFYLLNREEKDVFVDLPLFFAYALFNKHINDSIKYPKTKITFNKELRPGQKAIIEQVKKDFNFIRTSTICAPTGYGKTAMGCYTASHLGLVTLVLCPMTILLKQWKKSFNDFTDAKVWIVDLDDEPPKEVNVVICLTDRVCKLDKEFLDQVGLLIIDEAHMLCTPSEVKNILAFHPKYILAETATPERSDSMKVMLECLCGTEMIQPKYFKKEGKAMMDLAGYISEVKPFEVVKVNTGVSVEIKSNKMGSLDWSALVEDLSNSEERNKHILTLATKDKNAKVIILASRKKHVEDLQKLFLEADEKVQTLYGKKSNYSNCRILIGTVSKMGTGFDEENLCLEFDGRKADILIICASFKDKSLLTQVAGRIFRSETPLIYHLVDDVKTIKNHWASAKSWYNSRGAQITEIDM